MTDLPFIPDAVLERAIAQELEVIAAVRETTNGLATVNARLDTLTQEVAALRQVATLAASDSLRAANAATVSVGQSAQVLKAIADLRLLVAQAMGNGFSHG